MSQFYYAVICAKDGAVELSEKEYERQLDNPDRPWICPKCGDNAEWDDDCGAMRAAEE